MTYEIERRFVARVDEPSVLRADAGRRLEQVYLSAGEPGVRVRRDGEAYLLTVKAGRGLVRQEVETTLPPAVGRELMAMAGGHRLDKVRYHLGRWEIDVFEAALEGLILAEVELDSADETMPSPPPGIALTREVTDDGRFTNQSLASLPAAEAAALVRTILP